MTTLNITAGLTNPTVTASLTAGITQGEGDVRYLKLTGGTLTGKLSISLTSTASGVLGLANTITSTGNISGYAYANSVSIAVTPTILSVATTYAAQYIEATTASNSFDYPTNTQIRALITSAFHAGSSKLNGSVYGNYFDVRNTGSGGVSNLIGGYALVRSTGSGTITSAKGFEVGTPIISAGAITTMYGIYLNAMSGAGTNYAIYTNAGDVRLMASASDKLGFHGSAPVAKQTVSGSRGGNAALASLLTALATLGLIVDGSSA